MSREDGWGERTRVCSNMFTRISTTKVGQMLDQSFNATSLNWPVAIQNSRHPSTNAP